MTLNNTKIKYLHKRKINLISISLLIVTLLFMEIPVETQGLTPSTWKDVTVYSNNINNDQVIAVDSNENLWLATSFYSSPNYYIRLYKSTDGGSVWTQITQIWQSIYWMGDMDIAVDLYNNYVYVVYTDLAGGSDYDIKILRWSGTSSTLFSVSSGLSYDNNPSIAIDYNHYSSNYVYVSFERRIGENFDNMDLYVYRSTNDGATWGLWKSLGYGWDFNVYSGADIAIGDNGYVYISYIFGTDWSTKNSVRVAYSARSSTSGSWAYFYTLYTHPYISVSYSTIAASRYYGYPWVAVAWSFKDAINDFDIYARSSTDGGSSWRIVTCVACSNDVKEFAPNLAPVGMSSIASFYTDLFMTYTRYSISTGTSSYEVRKSSYTNPSDFSVYHSSSEFTWTNIPRSMGITTIFKPHGGTGVIVAYRGSYGIVKVGGDLYGLVRPIYTSPAKGTITNDETPYLNWGNVAGTYRYHLQVARSSSFSPGSMAYENSYTIINSHYTVPIGNTLREGIYYWRVRSRDSLGEYGQWSYSSGYYYFYVDTTPPSTVSLNSPISGSYLQDRTPTMQWFSTSTATQYKLEVSKGNANFAIPYVPAIYTTSTSYTPTSNWAQGTYYWRVSAKDAVGNWNLPSTYRSFTIDTIAPPSPSLLIPASGATVKGPISNPSLITFDWSDSSGTPWRYKLQVSKSSNFSPSQVKYTTVSSTTPSTASISLAYGDGLYYWRVKARDFVGNWGTYSTSSTFTLDTTGPDPTLSSPQDGAVTNDSSPLIRWNQATDAVRYQLLVDNNADFSSPVIDITQTSTTYTPLTPLSDGIYFYKVRAIDAAGNWGAYTATWRFTVDTSPPGIPTLASPLNGDVTNNQFPDLRWIPVTSAVEYLVQLDDANDFSYPIIEEVLPVTVYSVRRALRDGVFFWRVKAKDAVGNWGSWSTIVSFTVDTTNPNAPTLRSPSDGSSTSSTSPQLQWNSVTGANLYRYVLDNTADFNSPIHNQTTTLNSFAPSNLADGLYYWKIRAKDSANNWGDWSTTWTISVDTVGPVIPNLITPLNLTISTSLPDMFWSAVPDAVSYQVQVDTLSDYSSVTKVVDFITNATSYTTTVLADGPYFWRVRGKDAVGNWGLWNQTGNFTIDATPPGIPTLSSPTDAVILTVMPHLQWGSVIDAVEYQFQVDSNSSFNSPVQNFTTSTSYILDPLNDNLYYWRVRARDDVGNWGSWSTVWTFTIDKAGPAPPTLNAPASGAVVKSISQLQWSTVAGTVMYQVQLSDDASFSTFISDSTTVTTTFTPSSSSDGNYYWRVRGQDSLGNWGDWSSISAFTIDTTVPSATILTSPTNGGSVSSLDVLFSWEEDINATQYQIQISGSAILATILMDTTVSINSYGYTVPADATYYWRVRSIDAAGNIGAWSTVWSFTIVYLGPSAPSLASPVDGISTRVSPELIWASVTNATEYQAQVSTSSDFSTILSDVTVTSTSYSTSGLQDSTYYWRIRSRDSTGQVGAWSAIWSFIIDTTGPIAPTLSSPADASTSNTATNTLTWVADTDAKEYHIQISTDSSFVTTIVNTTGVSSSYTTSSFSDNTYYWRVCSIDAAGNVGDWSAIWSFTVEITTTGTPTITSTPPVTTSTPPATTSTPPATTSTPPATTSEVPTSSPVAIPPGAGLAPAPNILLVSITLFLLIAFNRRRKKN